MSGRSPSKPSKGAQAAGSGFRLGAMFKASTPTIMPSSGPRNRWAGRSQAVSPVPVPPGRKDPLTLPLGSMARAEETVPLEPGPGPVIEALNEYKNNTIVRMPSL